MGPTPIKDWQTRRRAAQPPSARAFSRPSHHSETIFPGCLGLFQANTTPALIGAIYHLSGGVPSSPFPSCRHLDGHPMSALLLVQLSSAFVSSSRLSCSRLSARCSTILAHHHPPNTFNWPSCTSGQLPCLTVSVTTHLRFSSILHPHHGACGPKTGGGVLS